MCGVIVVDAESFRSTCHGLDAYIHDHCLRYRHNFASRSLAIFQTVKKKHELKERLFADIKEVFADEASPKDSLTCVVDK